ncbi:DinB family protein [Herpetosiphon llansteffanensis]|uniref:DinB family protein n=1 Tax=Herpetosiphon llansteffanensis TaxID=2094568 RepID=UPI000D7C411F|nr:DinB family protein [Herpetosiphon llansteffanensis]
MSNHDQLALLRQKHIELMRLTLDTLGHVLSNVSQDQATSLRDGSNGWTVVEVLCHLRDYDQIFLERAIMMRDQDFPLLPGYDHEAMAIERNYNSNDLRTVYAALQESRPRFIAFFQALSPEQWAKAGTHPERGYFSLTDAAMQVGIHDVIHLEQISRILLQAKGQ